MSRLTLHHFFTFLCLFIGAQTFAQVTLTVRINSGSSGTSCTDGIFGGAPEPHWRVEVAGQGYTTYPSAGICFTNPPNTQYNETFDCPNNYPANLQVCFRAFEDDGAACIVSQSCLEQICQNFATPAPGASITYNLSIPNCCGNGSWGTVNFTIQATGAFTLPGSAYDQICNAVNLGTLPSGASIGNDALSNYGNFCAGNAGEPNPWGGGSNQQGVWFRFTTGANPAATIRFNANSDPQNLGDGLDLQLALYSSSNGTCTGALNLVRQEHDGIGVIWDEEMFVDCLQPNTTYFLMVDGEGNIFSSNGQQGFFGLEIYDNGITQAGDQICQAQHLGTVPAGGQVATPNLSQTNICATNTGDPNPGNWTSDQTVWFSFIAPPSGHVIIEADSDLPWPIGTDAVDLQLALYSTNNNTCTGTLEYIDSDYDPIIFDEDLDVRCLEAGRIYYILVDGSGLNVDGIFDIAVRDGGIPPAPHDVICNAIALGAPVPNGTVGLNNQNNYCANNLFEPIPANWGNDQGVWYTFVAPPSGKVEIRLENLGFFSDQIDLQVAVYDALNQNCTDPLTEIKSEYEGFGLLWDEDMEVECLIPGRTYYILVDGQGSLINPDLQEGTFDIEVWADPRDPAGPNDLPCNAIHLGDPTFGPIGTTPGPSHGSQNNFCATAAGEPNPSGFTPTQTVWYTFVAPPSGNVRIRGFSDALFGGVDPIKLSMAVWETPSCTGPWREMISGNDLITIDIDMEVFCLIPGETYYLQVDGTPPVLLLGWHEGYFDITINEIPPIPIAPNDLICDAIDLGNPFTGPSVALNQNNLCATDFGDPQPSAFGTDQTVWYSFVTPATGGPYAVTIDATTGLPWPFGSGSIDLQLAVYESSNNTCTGTLTEVISEYDPIIFDETVLVQCLEENRRYFVMVDGSWWATQGYFDISITPATSVPIPTNDLICDAINLGNVPVGGSINTGTDYFNFCADTEPGEPSPFGIDQTVWFAFQAPMHGGANASSEVTVRVRSDPNNVGDAIDLQLAVYESSNGACTGAMSLLEDGSSDPLFSFNADVSVTCLVPGETYWVQVDGTILNMEGYFTIQVIDDGSGQFPSNDNICNAINLGAVPNGGSINNNTNYFNFCATTEPGEPNPSAFGIDETVWFTFQAPASGNVTIDLNSDPNNQGDDPDLQIGVWYSPGGSCTGPWIEIDSDYDFLFFDETLQLECLIPGATYYVQVDGNDGTFGGDEGYFTIEIADDGGTTNFPYNNDICNAYNFGAPTGTFTTLNNETNECANVQFGEPGVGSYATNTVWYQFTAPPSGRVEVEVVSSNLLFGMDPEVYLFASSNNACTGAFSQMESSNWPTALITENIEATCLIPGNTYFIQVDGSGLVREGTFTIRIRDMFPLYGTGLPGDPQPVNDYCNNALPIPVQSESCENGTGSWNMYNYGFPSQTVTPSCGQNCGETWYTFSMPASGIALVEGNDDGVGSGFPIGDFSDLHVQAYSGACGSLTALNCGGGGFLNDVGFEIAAPPGTQIFLQVFNDGGDDAGEDYELCVSEGCGADHCLNAMAYPIQPNIPYCFNTAAANGENVSGGAPGYFECGEGDNPEHSIYYYFVSDCNGSAVTLHVINATASGGCFLGTIPDDGFNISFFQDATPCDNNPDALVDCQNFNSCMVQPINWSFTYNNLLPNTPYIIQIDGGFNFLGGDNSGYIMIQTTTNPLVFPTATPVTCGGTNDGTATATVVGGVSPFTFLWSNGATDSIATGLAPGNYTVTVTSAGIGGCFDTATVNVGAPSLMDAIINNATNASCNTSCDGAATAGGIGGVIISGYSFLWDANANNQTTQTATGLCPGNYIVTVSDNGGCSDTTSVTITNPPPVIAAVVSTVDALCNGICDGEATVSASGGTVTIGYLYAWPMGNTTAAVTGLCAGTYLVTITDNFGCFDTISVSINQPLSVEGSIANQTDIDCNGDLTGSVEILAINGTAPYQFNIGNGLVGGNTFTGLGAGNYSVTVQDVNGCTDTVNVLITEPPLLAAQLVTSMDASCNGLNDGSLTASASGGLAPYEFSIDGLNFFAAATFNNLSAGNYTVTVRDANGCTATVPVTINEPTAVSIVLDAQTVAGCGICDGTASITPSGGAGGFSYLWTSGETIQDAVALCSGNNFVTVTDANGCTASIPVNIGNSSALAVNTTIDQVISCFGDCNGQITITPLGGTAPYTYIWSTGATSSTVSGLCAGAYAATVSDNNGCFVVENINLTAPTQLSTLAAELQPVSCFGNSDGQAVATPSGGTLPYSFAWDNGETTQTATALNAGTHSILLTDANACTATASVTITEPTAFAVAIINTTASDCGSVICNGTAQISVGGGVAPYTYLWSNGSTTAAPTNLCPNFNDITVTDASGCTATAAVNIPSNSTLGISLINSTNPDCFGDCNGTAIVSASGGNTGSPYIFNWDNGSTTANLTGLCDGIYRVTVSDIDGCSNAMAVTITEPNELLAQAVVSSNYNGFDVSCNGASDATLSVNVIGGTTTYGFAWSGGQLTQNINGLSAGMYNVTVTDANGCNDTSMVVVTEPSAVTVTATISSDYNGSQVSCVGATDGTATANAAGGTGNFSFVWSNGQSAQNVTGLAAGTYTVTANDDNNCPATAMVTVTDPTALAANATALSNYNGFNVSCPNAADGEASASGIGGTGAYTFAWSTGETTQNITGLAAGVYDLTLSDANGCQALASVTITAPTPLTNSFVSNAVSCNSGNDGEVTANPVGGVPNYSFAWSNGDATATAIGLAAGVHSVTITDANTCTMTDNVTVTEPSAITLTGSSTNALCYNQASGTATINVAGGTPNYTYLWSNGQNTQTATGLLFGNYTVTVTDANACTISENINVANSPQITYNASTTDALCFGDANGAAVFNVAGGVGGFTYLWSNGQTTASVTGLLAGNYCVTASDANGCPVDTCLVINEPAALGNASFTVVDMICSYAPDGQLTFHLTGGTLPYSYLWSNGQNTQTASGLGVGTYSVTVTDANGCTFVDAASITSPPALQLSFATDSVHCKFDNDGAATAMASGGVGNYTYLWSNGGNTATINNLTAGNYAVTVTDGNGCTISGSVFVGEPATAVMANVLSTIHVSCFGGMNGAIDADALGGTPNYTFLWSNGATTEDLTGLAAGIYSLTATDARGCSATTSTTLIQPTQIVTNLSLYSNYNGAAISCPGADDGAVRVTTSGGNIPYTIAWSNGQNTPLITGLGPGTYTVTVTDAGGCAAINSISIVEPLPLQGTAQHTDIFCFGDCDGTITVNAVSGTGTLGINGYEYRILGQNGNLFTGVNSFFGLCAGTYTVELRDGNDCVLPLSVTITEPPIVTATTSVLNSVSCHAGADGSASVLAAGGVAPFSYQWSNGQSGATATGLAAGSHQVTVTDANGCDRVASVIITQPNHPLTATTSSTAAACNGTTNGAATVTASGGTAPYTYLWANGSVAQTTLGLSAGTHSVTVTDANGCQFITNATVADPAILTATITGANLSCTGNGTGSATVTVLGGTAPYIYFWNNGQTTATVTGLNVGTYTVLVTDFNGCQVNAQVTLSQPTQVAATISSTTNASCFAGADGSATASATGGTAPYTYSWSNGQNTATATGLASGVYTVTVSDTNGCFATATASINQPSSISVTHPNLVHVICKGGNDGMTSAMASGGSFPYNYQWSNGVNGQNNNNLSAGTYFVTVTDNNGCATVSSIIINEPISALVGVINISNALCQGGASGQLAAVISGGTLPTSGDYSYLWSNGATTPIVSGVTAGTYTVTVTDANGCTLSLSNTVGQGGNISLSLVSTIDATCDGGNDGSATITASGGSGTLTYQWSDGQASPIATGLNAGLYTVTVTDANGCAQSISVTINNGVDLTLEVDITHVSCFGANDGMINVTGGSVPPSLYFWSGNGITTVGTPASQLAAGQYTVTIVFTNGCSSSFTYNVTEPSVLGLDANMLTPVLCHDDATGVLQAQATGGTPSYNYAWSNGANASLVSGLSAGTYQVTLSDANGCTAVDALQLGNPEALGVEMSTEGVACEGDRNGHIQVTGFGGSTTLGLYEYSIDSVNWQTGDIFPNLGTGTYMVYVRDNNGCVLESPALIEAASPFYITSFQIDTTHIEYGDTINMSVMLNDTNGVLLNWLDVNAAVILNDSTYQLVVYPANTTIYEFSATNPFGCQVDTTLIVNVTKTRKVAAPLAFTPNGDGQNDNFFVQGDPDKVTKILVFRVYDRWGELIFDGKDLRINNPQDGWDGTFKNEKMSSGVYAWYAEVEFIDGESVIIKGDVTLLR